MAIILRDIFIGNIDVDEDLQLMRSRNDALHARATDINTQLQAEEMQPGRKRKRQVENWLNIVEELQTEVENFEKDIEKRASSSRKMLKSEIISLTREVGDLIEQGNFHNGLTLDDHACSAVPLVTTKLKGRLFQENLEMIISWLMDEDVCRIGVYGLGGIGKTTLAMHIHNKLHECYQNSVHVYWVTVSQDSTIATLQNKIAKAAKVEHIVERESDQVKRAAMLYAALKKRKNVVLFLDDMWKHFEAEKVGVPVGKDECKLVITTRLLDVCRRMDCQRRVKIEVLSKEESWDLFSEKLGCFDDLSPEVRDVAKLVAKKCAGLPLGISVIAGSMRGVADIHEWSNTLEELSDFARHNDDMVNDVFPLLELSYVRLNDVKLQKCFLSCALYPEDSKLNRKDLINFWVSDCMFEEIESREKQLDKGHTILNRLVNASLLEPLDSEGKIVSMHDLIRDMAVIIGRDTHHFMIRSGLQLTDVPDEREWTDDLIKVSLISNKIVDIAGNVSPVCSNLSTLLLEDNPLKYIPDMFFLNMKGLRFLSLARAPIKKLPDSISELENLSALVMSCCGNVIYVPSLTKLVKLRELDLSSNESLKDLPQGIEVLPNLRFLSLANCNKLCVSFHNLVTGLSNIEHLEIGFGIKDVTGKSLMELRHLKRLKGCWISNVSDFNSYIKSQHFHQLKYYQFYISAADFFSDFGHIFDKSVVIHEYSKEVACKIEPLLLPYNIQFLQLVSADYSIRSLSDIVPSVHGLTRLVRIWIGYCQGLEYMWASASSFVTELENLVELNLSELKIFSGLYKAEVPGGAFHNLKKLTMEYCSKIKFLFTPCVLSQMQNLEILEIQVCAALKELISLSDSLDDAEGENSEIPPIVGSHANTTVIHLPKLRTLQLVYLPNLVTLCSEGLLGCHHIEYITIVQCPLLKKLPFSFQLLDNGQQFKAPISLKRIIVEKEWWESLVWDQPSLPYLLQPHIEF